MLNALNRLIKRYLITRLFVFGETGQSREADEQGHVPAQAQAPGV